MNAEILVAIGLLMLDIIIYAGEYSNRHFEKRTFYERLNTRKTKPKPDA